MVVGKTVVVRIFFLERINVELVDLTFEDLDFIEY
jgi:hypothetical protein